MKPSLVGLLAALALVAVACGSEASAEGVASLSDTDTTIGAEPSGETEDLNVEESFLAFTQCMRDEGIDLPDPELDANGNITFGGFDRDPGADPEDIRAAFGVCQEHIEGVVQQFIGRDLTEIQDTLVEYAACMRENGYDMPDPDFSGFGPGQGGGPFGGAIDPNDPAFQTANEICQEIFTDAFGGRLGGPGNGRPGS
ncbi:MAG: hypothetical protein ACE5MI_12565 [Acidimicrobiia bacterium]